MHAGGDSRALELVLSVGVEDLPAAVVAIEMWVRECSNESVSIVGKPIAAVGQPRARST